MFKVKRCGSSLLTSNRKMNLEQKLLISKRNCKRKSAVKVVAMECTLQNLKQKITNEGGRESD